MLIRRAAAAFLAVGAVLAPASAAHASTPSVRVHVVPTSSTSGSSWASAPLVKINGSSWA